MRHQFLVSSRNLLRAIAGRRSHARDGNIFLKRYLSSSHLLPAYFASDFIQNSPHFRVEKIEGKGRGFIATTDIAAGTVLFMEKPIVSFRNLTFHSELMDEYCPNCYKKISLASKHYKHKYCSKKCMIEASNEHKKITGKLNLEPILEYSARSGGKFILIVVRMVAASLLSGKEFQNYWRKINLLCYAGTDASNIPEEWVIEYEMIKKAYMKVLGDENGNKIFNVLNIEWYAHLIGTMHLNMMSLNPDIGVGCPSSILFFNGSLFNHSCYPNVNIGWKSFSGDDQEFNDTLKQLNKSNECDEIDHCKPSVASAGHSDLDNPFCLDDSNTIGYFKTNQSIKVGEELTISYVDAYKDCTVKKEELAFAYNIHCNECNCT